VFLKTGVSCFQTKDVLLAKIFFCPSETSGVDSGIFCDYISNPYEVSNEVAKMFSKFQAKMNN
jgi:hypothetical protein